MKIPLHSTFLSKKEIGTYRQRKDWYMNIKNVFYSSFFSSDIETFWMEIRIEHCHCRFLFLKTLDYISTKKCRKRYSEEGFYTATFPAKIRYITLFSAFTAKPEKMQFEFHAFQKMKERRLVMQEEEGLKPTMQQLWHCRSY